MRIEQKKHTLYTLNKHHTARNNPESLSPGSVQGGWSGYWRRDLCNHSQNMLLAKGRIVSSSDGPLYKVHLGSPALSPT